MPSYSEWLKDMEVWVTRMTDRNGKDGHADSMVKNLELVVAVIVIPHFLSVMSPLPTAIAYSLGAIIAFLATYWVPPRSRVTFRKWMLSGLLAATFILIFTSMVDLLRA